MTTNRFAAESWWVRLGRAMGPGLYSLGVLAGMPIHRAAVMAAHTADPRSGSDRDREAAR